MASASAGISVSPARPKSADERPLQYWVDQVCTRPGVHRHAPAGPRA